MILMKKKIRHTGDTESLNRCGGADSIFFRSPVGRFSEEEEKNGLQDFQTGMLNQTVGLLNLTPKLDSSSGLLG